MSWRMGINTYWYLSGGRPGCCTVGVYHEAEQTTILVADNGKNTGPGLMRAYLDIANQLILDPFFIRMEVCPNTIRWLLYLPPGRYRRAHMREIILEWATEHKRYDRLRDVPVDSAYLPFKLYTSEPPRPMPPVIPKEDLPDAWI